ncbi:hypothetical protein B0H13DRAFT_2301005 [Mycena leptocephala]|nr:hypothetical protein B0H13DRAFT_2301005 [Mycena leptocephala]
MLRGPLTTASPATVYPHRDVPSPCTGYTLCLPNFPMGLLRARDWDTRECEVALRSTYTSPVDGVPVSTLVMMNMDDRFTNIFLMWAVAVDTCADPVQFNMDVGITIQTRDARPPSKLMAFLGQTKILTKSVESTVFDHNLHTLCSVYRQSMNPLPRASSWLQDKPGCS